MRGQERRQKKDLECIEILEVTGDGGGHGCRVRNPLGLETQIPVCCLLKGFTLSARGKT